MDDAQAKKVARAHTDATTGEGRFASVRAACAALLPEASVWALLETAENRMPLVVAVGQGAIFRREVRPEGQAADVEVRRFTLEDAQASVIERVAADRYDGRVRNRTWLFVVNDGRERLTLDTQETPDEGVPDLELVARAAARASGWHVSD